MGLPDSTLRRIQVRTGIVPKYDRLHPIALAQHVQRCIGGSSLFDFRPDLHDRKEDHDDQPAVAGILGAFFKSQSGARAL